MEPFFLVLSGENPTLPSSEAEAVLDSESCPVADIFESHRIMRLKTTQKGAEAVSRRAAYTRTVCREVFSCDANESRILEMVGQRISKVKLERLPVTPDETVKGETFP